MLSDTQKNEILEILSQRLAKLQLVPQLSWAAVRERLLANEAKLASLYQMEATGGEPNLVAERDGELLFYDCAPQSPAGRVSLCYDEAALAARKKNPPAGSAWGMAREMGVAILNEDEYRFLQTLGEFDTKSSSWLATPDEMRALGGALFGDCRYGRVFAYHNGAESYYSGRGFRAVLRV